MLPENRFAGCIQKRRKLGDVTVTVGGVEFIEVNVIVIHRTQSRIKVRREVPSQIKRYDDACSFMF